MKPYLRALYILAGALLLDLPSIVAAHGGGKNATTTMSGNMGSMGVHDASHPTGPKPAATEPASYFRHSENSGLMLAHVVCMCVGWVFILPLSTASQQIWTSDIR
jgi:hypothetical protein